MAVHGQSNICTMTPGSATVLAAAARTTVGTTAAWATAEATTGAAAGATATGNAPRTGNATPTPRGSTDEARQERCPGPGRELHRIAGLTFLRADGEPDAFAS